MAETRIGVIGIPGKWSTETLADEVESRTGFRLVIDMAQVHLDLVRGHLLYRNFDLCRLDALMVKKISQVYSPNTLDRLELLRVAEAAGVRVFSPALSMLRLVDRLSCTVTLANGGIPMPPTCVTESVDAAIAVVHEYRGAVFKPLYSTKARGMEVIESTLAEADLRARITAFHAQNSMMYIQRKINLPGQDMGLMFLGGEYLGAYSRVSGGDTWNTTIHHGGKYAPAEPEADRIEIASRAQALFGMDFTTVDLAETDNGPVVFEVSAFGGFNGAKQGLGINVAALYADYALAHLNRSGS